MNTSKWWYFGYADNEYFLQSKNLQYDIWTNEDGTVEFIVYLPFPEETIDFQLEDYPHIKWMIKNT